MSLNIVSKSSPKPVQVSQEIMEEHYKILDLYLRCLVYDAKYESFRPELLYSTAASYIGLIGDRLKELEKAQTPIRNEKNVSENLEYVRKKLAREFRANYWLEAQELSIIFNKIETHYRSNSKPA